MMKLTQQFDETRKLWTMQWGERRVLEYIYADEQDPNPSFRRVATPAGHELALYRPWDHPWHLGLFFSWKYINGLNFWESWHHGQRNVAVTRSFAPLSGSHAEPGFVQSLDYVAHDGNTLLREVRSVEVQEVDLNSYAIVWTGRFRAGPDTDRVELNRTEVTPKSPWGGYAGLAFRLARTFLEPIITTDAGRLKAEEAHNRSFAWCDYSGKVDGFLDPQYAGVAFVDDPRNPRHPSPMLTYDYKDMQFLQAALLQNEPLILQSGEDLTLRYVIYVHDGSADASTIAKLQDSCTERL